MAKDSYPSYLSCVANILSNSFAPLTIDSLVTRIQAQRPVGKGVRSAVYQAVNKLYQAVPVAPGQYGWLSYLLKEQWFRHPLNSVEVRKGYLLLDELEHAVFFPQFFQTHEPDNRTIRIELMGGPMIEASAEIEQGTWALRLGQPFVSWVDEIGGTTYDDLLIWVKDAVAGEYGVRLQPRESRQEELIEERNRLLVWTAEDVVSSDRKSRSAVPVWELAAALVARGMYSHDVAPDDMHYVLHEYSRLRLYDDLGYAFEDQIPSLQQRQGQARAESHHPHFGPDLVEMPPWLYVDGHHSWRQDEESLDLFEDTLEIDPEMLWELPDAFDDDESDEASEHCEGYQSYLTEFYGAAPEHPPLSHMEFHLLEAELEMLIGLEQEFGYLMPEQESRKIELAERLFVDLNYFYDDWDQSDHEDPPYWQN